MSNFIDIVVSAPPIYIDFITPEQKVFIDVVMPLIIQPAIPSGKFLKDDGTWASPSDIAAIWSSLTGNIEDQLDLIAYITAQIDAAKAAIINGAPGALDDLNKISAAIGDNPDFAVAVAGALALKQDSLGFTPYDAANPEGYVTNSLPRSASIASSATPSIDISLYDCYSITAQATAITGVTIVGVPVNFQPLIIRILDNGTARAITLGAFFTPMGEALPTTTTLGKILTVAFLYDSVLAKWGCVGVKNEA